VTFFLWKKDIRYQYINNFQINCFLSITLKFILSLVSRGLGALQGNFGPDFFNVIMALISPNTNQPFIVPIRWTIIASSDHPSHWHQGCQKGYNK
jgi:hypothetical protein